MACYHPITCFRSKSGPRPNGRWPIVFDNQNGLTDEKNTIKIPCGKCIGCQLEYARQWAIRCVHEAACWENNCFITLTYREEDYKKYCINGSLNKREYVLFMKRLRKEYGKRIRFFHCGEYGEGMERAHHHACLFNFDFPDKKQLREKDGIKLWVSESLEKIWSHGWTTIGAVTEESAAYCARYVIKKQVKRILYYGRTPEYTTMSRRMGIGKPWMEQFGTDIYPRGTLINNGIKQRPPRYYDDIYDKIEPEIMKKIREERIKHVNEENCTTKRLLVREEFAKLKLKKFAERNYENGTETLRN